MGALALEIHRNLCSDLKERSPSCKKCLAVCPEGAIEFKDTLRVSKACSECGVCYSACPNGALVPVGGTDRDILSAIDRVAEKGQADPLRISCREVRAPSGVRVSCLARLTETLIIGAARTGARRLLLIRGACEECRFFRAMDHFDTISARSRVLLDALGLSDLEVEMARMEEDTRASRRALLLRAGATLAGVLERSLPGDDPEDGTEGSRNDRREGLLEAIGDTQAMGSPPDGLFAKMAVDPEKCDGCGVCGALCPVGAVKCEDTTCTFRLHFTPAECTACGICERVCARRALSLKAPEDLAPLVSRDEVTVVDLGKRECPICRVPFVLESGSTCAGCRIRGRFGPFGAIEKTSRAFPTRRS